MLSVFTQTIPGPPPGAGADFATVSVFAAAPVAAAGLGEVFGLNKSANVLCGDAEACGAAVAPAVAAVVIAAFLRVVLAAGSVNGGLAGALVATGAALAAGEASVLAAFFRVFFAGDAEASAPGEALVAGEASAAASFFLRDFFAGEAEASAPAAALASGDAAGLASAFAFLCDLVLAGDSAGDGDGDWACATDAAAKPKATSKTKYLVLMGGSLMSGNRNEKTENALRRAGLAANSEGLWTINF